MLPEGNWEVSGKRKIILAGIVVIALVFCAGVVVGELHTKHVRLEFYMPHLHQFHGPHSSSGHYSRR